MHIWLHTLLHEKHIDTFLPHSDILTSSGQRLASGAMSRTAVSLCCAVVKENGVHNEFCGSTWWWRAPKRLFSAGWSHMPHLEWEHDRNRKLFRWPYYFESLMAAKISWLKSAPFFPVGRLKRKSLCQQATHHTGTGKRHSTWNCCV